MIPRIYLPPDSQLADQVRLDAEQSLYLTQALRLKKDACLIVFDGHGGRREATLTQPDRRQALVALGPPAPGPGPSPVHITLVQGVASGDRMDWVIEKAVELGVARIMPVICTRTSVRLSTERAIKRLAHWHRIAVAACRQCGRDDLPLLMPVAPLEQVLTDPDPDTADDLRILLHPTGSQPLTALLGRSDSEAGNRVQPVHLLIGPESGLSDEESEAAIAAGFKPATLGPRVLRTETAGVVAAAVVQAMRGDFANDRQIMIGS